MRNNAKRWIGAAILYALIFIMVFFMTACSGLPFFDKDIVVKQEPVPCPIMEPEVYCHEGADFAPPPTARHSLLLNAYYRKVLACLDRREELRRRARADCGDQ